MIDPTPTRIKERPIIFSAPMVSAILDGRKTQTRRAVKFSHDGSWEPGQIENSWVDQADPIGTYPTIIKCPYGVPGDRMWVRESARIIGMGRNAKRHYIDYRAGRLVACDSLEYKHACAGMFYAPGEADPPEPDEKGRYVWPWKTRSSIPRWASRITLEITGVRVERLQNISEADAIAEGAEQMHGEIQSGSYRDGFWDLWESINGKGSWAANPWVWVVEFRRCV